MGQIFLKTPDSPYGCKIETEGMDVELRRVFLGVRFISESGEELSVCMRDSGFEIRYSGENFDYGWIEFKNGNVGKI